MKGSGFLVILLFVFLVLASFYYVQTLPSYVQSPYLYLLLAAILLVGFFIGLTV